MKPVALMASGPRAIAVQGSAAAVVNGSEHGLVQTGAGDELLLAVLLGRVIVPGVASMCCLRAAI
jgi:hypothetical protein